MPWRFSRSHSQAYKQCPKFYYLTNHEKGVGIVSKRLNMGLSRGTLAHEMLREILSWCVTNDSMPPADFVRSTMQACTAIFIGEAFKRHFAEVDPAYTAMEVQRQATLVEGAVRAWINTRLPFILQNYRIVQVEKEFEVEISSDLTLMCRLDGVLQRRDDGEFSALEFKTTSVNFADYFDSWRYATQTMFHLLAIQKQFGKVGNSVLMEFLCLGTKRHDEVSGVDVYYSPLVRGYKKVGNPPLEPAVEYTTSSQTGRGRAWNIVNVWEDGVFPEKAAWMSNAEYWVEHVLEPEVLSGVVVTREIFRNPDELEESLRNTIAQQRRIYQGLNMLAIPGKTSRDEIMSQFFPGNMDESCFQNKYHKRCDMCPLCYKEVTGDPIESGLYQMREPHHPEELEV